MSNLKKGFVHTVFFWLKEKDNAEHAKALHEGLLKLALTDVIETSYIGQPAATNRAVIDSTYDFSLTFVFKTKEDQDIYQTHPDHIVFIESCSALWEKVVVYDAES
jgi:hypothetical protein